MSISSVTSANLADTYASLSSGQRINSAADDAAGLSISEELESQTAAAEQNVENISSMDGLLQTADGALESISDSLQSIRELAIQAANGTLSDSDKQAIQDQVDQYKQDIDDVISNSNYNTISLFDGSSSSLNTSMNEDGSGTTVSISELSLESLGIADFDVTGDYELGTIDNAISAITETRSQLGATSNSFDYATNSINSYILNTTSSLSQIQDQDMVEGIMNMNQLQLKQSIQAYVQQMKKEDLEQGIGTAINVML